VGLKSDIYDALENNIGKEHIKNSPEGKAKIDTLAEDLANAILDFLTNKDRCVLKVDKLNMNYTSGPTPVTAGPPTPHTIPLLDIGVDKKGKKLSNPVGNGSVDSNASEVRLRKSNVRGESDKY